MNNNDIFFKAQGRAAMMAFIVLCVSYTATGQLIPGLYNDKFNSRNTQTTRKTEGCSRKD